MDAGVWFVKFKTHLIVSGQEGEVVVQFNIIRHEETPPQLQLERIGRKFQEKRRQFEEKRRLCDLDF